jgi:cytochrome bd-type quinol oxidase subunit 1
MNFPFWDPPIIGGGMLIGFIAIVHVFVAHFAVGGGLYLVLTERKARQTNDTLLLESVKRHSRFFILVTLVFGAVTGVGIWWTIGLVAPSATSTLIHIFVWGWAIEWLFFLVEIVAAFIYYNSWDRLDAKTHMTIGWIYFVFAWLSLFVINGILTFMLTTGDWIEDRTFYAAFFNPTMLPSLVIRTAICIALAGVFALITGGLETVAELRTRIHKYASKWILIGTAIIPVGGIWYIASIPPLAREISMGGAPVVTMFAASSILLSILIVASAFFGPYLFPKHFHVTGAFFIAFLALMVTGVTEWVREAVRKPYVIYDYMYSNSIRPEQISYFNENGFLKNVKWAFISEEEKQNPLKKGEMIFRFQCQSCHTVNGFNAIRPAVKGWSREFLDYQIQHLDELKGYMPPFAGNEDDRHALVEYLLSLHK